MKRFFCLYIGLMICSCLNLFAQSDTVKIDSNYSVTPLKSLGSVSLIKTENIYRNISKDALPHINYTEFADIIEANIPIFPLSFGAAGQRNSFSAFGAEPNQIAMQFNNRPMTDRKFFNINLNQTAPEFLENIQILAGSEAVVNENNSSGLLINIKEIVYNTKYPYTKLWYSQGGDNLLSADGIFSQNIHPNLNFYFGFRSQSSKGAFSNTAYDSWNIRTGLRYNPNEKTSISLNHIFTNYKLGENGGIDTKNSIDIYDNISSAVNFYEYQSQVFRHDLNLTYSQYLTYDSSSALSASAFFSNSVNENRRDSSMALPNNDSDPNFNYADIYYGAKLSYEQKFFDIAFKAGAETYQYSSTAYKGFDSYSGNKTSFFTSFNTDILKVRDYDYGGKLYFKNTLNLYAGYRMTNYRNSLYHNAGARLTFSDEYLKFFTDLSFSQTLPNDFELNLSNKENHILALADLKYKLPLQSQKILFLINGYFRSTQNPIIYFPEIKDGKAINTLASQADKRTAYGATGTVFFDLFKNFSIKLWASYNSVSLDDKETEILPQIYSGIDISYLMLFGRSTVTLGADFNFKTSHKAYSYMPLNRSYYITDTEANAMNNGINLYAFAKLGTAYVKASLINVLSSNYYFTAVNPMQTRNLRLSVHWAFLD